MADTEIDVGQFPWLVESRNRIQALLLRVHDLTPTPTDDNSLAQFELLVGTAFSLWRAVFLALDGRNEKTVQENARTFLCEIIATNQIAFSNDRKAAAWSGGYYVNNAFWRLAAISDKRGATSSLCNVVKEYVRTQGVPGRGSSGEEMRGLWKLACDATEEIIAEIEGEQQASAASGRQRNERHADGVVDCRPKAGRS